jgi:cell shape-determining protein MreC
VNRSRALGVWLLLCCAAAWLSLRPARVLAPAFESGFSPLRFCADLAAPLLVACGGGMHADASDARRTLIEGVKSTDVRRALARAAEPTEPALRAGRHLVPGEVLQRSRDKRDVLTVRVPGEAIGIECGDPVVCGNVYVGRVCAIDNFAQGRISVEMVTDPLHGAGAVAIAATGVPLARLVIGGLYARSSARAAPAASRRLALALSSTSELVDGAAVRMFAGGPELHEHEALVDGFRLGRLCAEGDGLWSIETELDYEGGLSQVCILLSEHTPRGEEGVPEHALADGRWIAARALSFGDPGGVRSGFLVSVGASDGIESGAVVWSRGALVGRVESVSRWYARVRRLDDPGCSVLAVASVADGAEPIVLGRLVSRGASAGGGVSLRWMYPRVLESGAREFLEADLYTGSGELGLPSGLALGRAALPTRGGDEIVILPRERAGLDIDPAEIWVRQTAAGEVSR